MASITKLTNGRKRIQVACPDGVRRSIRTGKMTMKDAHNFRLHLERLVACNIAGSPPDDETCRWLSRLPSAVSQAVAKCGLHDFAPSVTLGQHLDDYFTERSDVQGSTKTAWGHTRRNLLDFFGADKPLSEITEQDGHEWRLYLPGQGLSEPTIRKRCGFAKQVFANAVRPRKLIKSNPFAGLKSANVANPDRQFFVARATAEKVLAKCPDNEWRLLFALSRYGGLRCPSEHLLLRWSDVDWENGRMTVTSPKTAHHEGGGSRIIPLFPELRTHLEACHRESTGEGFVINSYRSTNASLRTHLLRIIKRAGVDPWPKLFQNLRASRETELVEQFPLQAACAWIGNSQAVAMKHYLMVRDEHFVEASQNPGSVTEPLNPNRSRGVAQNAAQHPSATSGIKGNRAPEVHHPESSGPASFEKTSVKRTSRVGVSGPLRRARSVFQDGLSPRQSDGCYAF